MKFQLNIKAYWAILVLCLAHPSVAQTDYTPQELLDSSVWYLPASATGVISNDRTMLFNSARLSFDDGRPLHALQIGDILSLDDKRAVNTVDHPNHANPTSQLEIRDVSTAALLKTVGFANPFAIGFDKVGRFYYGENGYLYRDTDGWSVKLPGGIIRALGFDNDFSELIILYVNGSELRLQSVDVPTKTIKADRLLSVPVPMSGEVLHLTQNRIIMVKPSGQITSYRISDLALETSALLDPNIVYAESKTFPHREQWLIIRDKSQFVYVVDIATGLRVFMPWLSELSNLSVSTDGKTAVCARTATSASDGLTHIEVRDVDSGQVITSIPALPPFYFIDVAEKAEKVMFSHAQIDINSGKILRSRGDLRRDPGAIKPLELISPDGKYIVGSKVPRNGTPYWLLDGTTLEPIAQLPAQLTYPTMWSGDSKHLVSVVDKTVTYWDVQTLSLISTKTFSGAEGLYSSQYAFIKDTNEFAHMILSSDTLNVYDIETWQIKRSLKLSQDLYTQKFWGMKSSENGRFLSISVYDGFFGGPIKKLYDAKTLNMYAIVSSDDRAETIHLSNDGRYCLLYTNTGYDGFESIFDAKRMVEERITNSTPIAIRMLRSPIVSSVNGGELLICYPGDIGSLCALRMPSSFGGVVSVPGRARRCSEMLATLKVFSSDGTQIINRQTRLGQAGRFSAGKPLDDGTYDVWIKPVGCLAARASGCTIPMKTDVWRPFSCVPGDVNGDNKIDAADANALSNAFDTFEGDEGYLPDAELTGDHYVGTDDYLLISQNVGKVGAD